MHQLVVGHVLLLLEQQLRVSRRGRADTGRNEPSAGHERPQLGPLHHRCEALIGGAVDALIHCRVFEEQQPVSPDFSGARLGREEPLTEGGESGTMSEDSRISCIEHTVFSFGRAFTGGSDALLGRLANSHASVVYGVLAV